MGREEQFLKITDSFLTAPCFICPRNSASRTMEVFINGLRAKATGSNHNEVLDLSPLRYL